MVVLLNSRSGMSKIDTGPHGREVGQIERPRSAVAAKRRPGTRKARPNGHPAPGGAVLRRMRIECADSNWAVILQRPWALVGRFITNDHSLQPNLSSSHQAIGHVGIVSGEIFADSSLWHVKYQEYAVRWFAQCASQE